MNIKDNYDTVLLLNMCSIILAAVQNNIRDLM
jgi:hypothetical protein